MAKLPARVPLPYVSEHTDNISFENLWLPPELDQERLEIRLKSLDRVRSLGGLGRLSVIGVEGQSNERPLARGKATLIPTVNTLGVTFNTDVEGTAIKINTDLRDMEVTVKQVNKKLDSSDAKPYAANLDKALRRGLTEACIDVNSDGRRAFTTAGLYGWLGIVDSILPTEAQIPFAAAALLIRPVLFGLATANTHLKNRNSSPGLRTQLSWYYQSFFFGATLDRLGLGLTSAQLSRFASARK